MKQYLSEFISNLCMFLVAVYIRISVCFIRAFLWAVPFFLIWNKIIVFLTGFQQMRYFQAYWICLVMMAFISATGSVNVIKKQ